MEISNFISTFKNDVSLIHDFFKSGQISREEIQKFSFAALRIISSVGLTYSTALGVMGAIEAIVVIDSLIKLSSAAVLFILFHDLYILGNNSSDELYLKTIGEKSLDYLKGRVVETRG